MLIMENIYQALMGLKANKMRTFLTMLGIVIGISSVIAVLTIGDGLNNSVMSAVAGIGANNIEMWVGVKEEMKDRADIRASKPEDLVTYDMLEALKIRFNKEISYVSVANMLGNVSVGDRGKESRMNILGLNDGGIMTKNLTILAGDTISEVAQLEGRKVILVADKLVEKSLGGDYNRVLGTELEVEINNKYDKYTIVGVYKFMVDPFSGGGMGGSDSKLVTTGYIPLQTAINVKHEDAGYTDFTVVGAAGVDSAKLLEDVKQYFEDMYYKNNDTYSINGYNLEGMKEEMNTMMNTVKLAISGIAAISLLVGGIGVMNIMIVTITERTREIGTRKALGATNLSIMVQFIVEAVVICVIGGIIGVAIGMALGTVVMKLMKVTGTASIQNIVGAVIFSTAFGVFFGYYPAKRAANLNPIDALRYE